MEFFFLPFLKEKKKKIVLWGKKEGVPWGNYQIFKQKKRCRLRRVVRLAIGVCLRYMVPKFRWKLITAPTVHIRVGPWWAMEYRDKLLVRACSLRRAHLHTGLPIDAGANKNKALIGDLVWSLTRGWHLSVLIYLNEISKWRRAQRRVGPQGSNLPATDTGSW